MKEVSPPGALGHSKRSKGEYYISGMTSVNVIPSGSGAKGKRSLTQCAVATTNHLDESITPNPSGGGSIGRKSVTQLAVVVTSPLDDSIILTPSVGGATGSDSVTPSAAVSRNPPDESIIPNPSGGGPKGRESVTQSAVVATNSLDESAFTTKGALLQTGTRVPMLDDNMYVRFKETFNDKAVMPFPTHLGAVEL